MHKISQSSQAWEGDAGAVQELDDVSLACVPERCRTGGQGRKTEGSADGALRLLTSNKDPVARAAARCMPLSGADPSVRSRAHAGIVPSATCADFRLQQ